VLKHPGNNATVTSRTQPFLQTLGGVASRDAPWVDPCYIEGRVLARGQVGSDVRVHLQMPVDDWEAVLDGIQENLWRATRVTIIPTDHSGSPRTDATLVHLLCRTLATAGVLPLIVVN
jgi:hypothetical protein